MKFSTISVLTIAATSLAFLQPHNAMAQDAASAKVQLVPAVASLSTSLDSKKAQAGQAFSASLEGKVRLANGTELPSGSQLIGTIVAGNGGAGAQSLSLKFVKAKVKGGKEIPITAIIVNVTPSDGAGLPPDALPLSEGLASGSSHQVDRVDVVKGVDLHSHLDGDQSSVFVATNKKDVKLGSTTYLSLAIE
jgi:hypothetical protein